MKLTTITGNGNFVLPSNNKSTAQKECTVYVPSSIGGATVTIGWLEDGTTNFNAYVDGLLAAGESIRALTGSGVALVANITGYTADFDIGIAE